MFGMQRHGEITEPFGELVPRATAHEMDFRACTAGKLTEEAEKLRVRPCRLGPAREGDERAVVVEQQQQRPGRARPLEYFLHLLRSRRFGNGRRPPPAPARTPEIREKCRRPPGGVVCRDRLAQRPHPPLAL